MGLWKRREDVTSLCCFGFPEVGTWRHSVDMASWPKGWPMGGMGSAFLGFVGLQGVGPQLGSSCHIDVFDCGPTTLPEEPVKEALFDVVKLYSISVSVAALRLL